MICNLFFHSDAFLVAVFLNPKVILTARPFNVTVELAGNFSRGQMILDHLFAHPSNCRIVETIDQELFKTMLTRTASDQ
jgi:inosine-uridine nucleoside N-ribohydrolase